MVSAPKMCGARNATSAASAPISVLGRGGLEGRGRRDPSWRGLSWVGGDGALLVLARARARRLIAVRRGRGRFPPWSRGMEVVYGALAGVQGA